MFFVPLLDLPAKFGARRSINGQGDGAQTNNVTQGNHFDKSLKGSRSDNRAASRKKVPNVLSHCHTKRRTGTCGCTHPSFGMTPTFQKLKKKSEKNLKSRCHTKRKAGTATRTRPCFGMTTTQDIRDLFV